MIQHVRALAVGLIAAAVLITGVPQRPAAANTTSTIVLGAAALIGGIILYNNYEHKKQAANVIVGYTRNGGTVYGDGRVVMPNGRTIYPNADGTYSGGGYAYYHPKFQPVAYDYDRTGRYDKTHHHDNRDFGHAQGNQNNPGHDKDGRGDRR